MDEETFNNVFEFFWTQVSRRPQPHEISPGLRHKAAALVWSLNAHRPLGAERNYAPLSTDLGEPGGDNGADLFTIESLFRQVGLDFGSVFDTVKSLAKPSEQVGDPRFHGLTYASVPESGKLRYLRDNLMQGKHFGV